MIEGEVGVVSLAEAVAVTGRLWCESFNCSRSGPVGGVETGKIMREIVVLGDSITQVLSALTLTPN